MKLYSVIIFFILAWVGLNASAAVEIAQRNQLRETVREEIGRQFPGAKIELRGDVQLLRGTSPESITSISVQNVSARGEASLLINGTAHLADYPEQVQVQAEAVARFQALMPAYVAARRIMPGEKLSSEHFTQQQVDVASGIGREYRGVIYSSASPVSRLEARQTVLEGQFLTTTAVQKIPDIRRGDSVKLQVVAGSLSVSTSGVAEEPAYIDGRVRVISTKTKREFIGRLLENGVVEVQL